MEVQHRDGVLHCRGAFPALPGTRALPGGPEGPRDTGGLLDMSDTPIDEREWGR